MNIPSLEHLQRATLMVNSVVAVELYLNSLKPVNDVPCEFHSKTLSIDQRDKFTKASDVSLVRIKSRFVSTWNSKFSITSPTLTLSFLPFFYFLSHQVTIRWMNYSEKTRNETHSYQGKGIRTHCIFFICPLLDSF